MATVIAEMSMSLDGFVADPSDGVRPLFDWYGNGEVETPTADPERWTFRTSQASARYLRESLERTGALVAGRRLFDIGGWGDGAALWEVPVLLGEGIRYFDNLSNAPVMLEGPEVIEGARVTHLIYRVQNVENDPAAPTKG